MSSEQRESPRRLRVIIDFDPAGGEPTIFPVADSDLHRAAILDALRIYLGEMERQGGDVGINAPSLATIREGL